jgi:tRNA 2-thiouridine synthesizing protein A
MARHLLDARGLRCPWPALRLARLMRQSAPGDEIAMLADDPKAPEEISLLAGEHGWSLVREDKDGHSLFTIIR